MGGVGRLGRAGGVRLGARRGGELAAAEAAAPGSAPDRGDAGASAVPAARTTSAAVPVHGAGGVPLPAGHHPGDHPGGGAEAREVAADRGDHPGDPPAYDDHDVDHAGAGGQPVGRHDGGAVGAGAPAGEARVQLELLPSRGSHACAVAALRGHRRRARLGGPHAGGLPECLRELRGLRGHRVRGGEAHVEVLRQARRAHLPRRGRLPDAAAVRHRVRRRGALGQVLARRGPSHRDV
mmetsp:Transcript_87629/g.252722  ORF Transcript_87629/g.252722 Transcript_87629/m.252722 type:complete len:237 (+) Transcript_87629:119-829(+)